MTALCLHSKKAMLTLLNTLTQGSASPLAAAEKRCTNTAEYRVLSSLRDLPAAVGACIVPKQPAPPKLSLTQHCGALLQRDWFQRNFFFGCL